MTASQPQQTIRAQWLAWLVIVVVPVEVLLCARVSVRHDLPALWIACAADAALLAGGALWVMSARSRNAGLRGLGLSPRRLLRLVHIALGVGGIAAGLVGLSHARQLFRVAALAELAVVAAIAVGLRRTDVIVPKVVVASVRDELALLASAWRSLSRRPVVPQVQPQGELFSTTRQSRVGMLVAALVLLSTVEAPALHLLMHAARLSTHLVIVAVHLYGIVWLIGDRRAMQESGHSLTSDGLRIHLGRRWRGEIRYRQIASARLVDSPERSRGAIRVSPADAPNVELLLHDPVTLTGYFGRARSATQVLLFVDEPDRFVAALAAARARYSSSS